MYKEIDGFIYKGQAIDIDNQLNLILFCVTSEGFVKVRLTDIKAYFFIESSFPTSLKSTNGHFVQKIEYSSLKEKNERKVEYNSQNVKTFEFDVKPLEQYLMDREIYASVRISGEFSENKFLNPKMSPTLFEPKFKIFSFDIETSKDGRVLSIAFIQGPVKKVLMLGSEKVESKMIEIEIFKNEVLLIKKIIEYINLLDPELIVGWNVIGFDLRFLFERCEKFNIPFSIGKKNQKVKTFMNARNEWVVDIPGRVVIDGPFSLKTNFFSFESYKLNEVSKIVLNETKDIDEDEVFDKWSEIERRFKEDKHSLAVYNLKDAELVLKIFEKTKLIELLYNRSMISGMLLERVGGSTSAFDHFFLPKLHQENIVALNVLDVEFEKEAKGGFVLTPKVGIHNNVVVLDFKSLYPTLIRTFKIDPLSRIKREIDPIKTPVGITFSYSQNILPGKIEKLLNLRSKAKKEKNENLSMAIKILMNSFYGVMGSSGCRFYHHELPEAITGTGQWILKTTIEYLESEGFEIVYGDTDSIFVKVKASGNIFSIGNSIVEKVNLHLSKYIKDEFNLDSFLEIQFDKVFKKLILTSARNNDEGAKKRYAGIKLKFNGDVIEEDMVFTGMEFVRSDWSKLAKNFQYNLLLKIFNEDVIDDYILDTIKKLERGEYDRDLVLKKRLTKPIEEYVKNIPPHVKALIQLKEKTGVIKKVSEYVMTKRGPMPIELKPTDFDYDYYIHKQLGPIANSLLNLVNKDFDQILNNQLSLF